MEILAVEHIDQHFHGSSIKDDKTSELKSNERLHPDSKIERWKDNF